LKARELLVFELEWRRAIGGWGSNLWPSMTKREDVPHQHEILSATELGPQRSTEERGTLTKQPKQHSPITNSSTEPLQPQPDTCEAHSFDGERTTAWTDEVMGREKREEDKGQVLEEH
jgi:hypothetical protein